MSKHSKSTSDFTTHALKFTFDRPKKLYRDIQIGRHFLSEGHIIAKFRKFDTYSLKDILLQYSESLSLILWRTYYCNIQKVWHSLSEGHITAIFRKLDMNFHTEEHITLIFRKPVTFSLKDILYYYCNFQKDLKSISEGHTVLLYSNIQKAWEFFS